MVVKVTGSQQLVLLDASFFMEKYTAVVKLELLLQILHINTVQAPVHLVLKRKLW